MNTINLTERIEQCYAAGVRAETSLGLAERLEADEDDVLIALISLVTSGVLCLHQQGCLLIFLTPDYLRELELAA